MLSTRGARTIKLPTPTVRIGSLNEKPLHAALKKWIAGPNDQFEVSVDGFVIDVVQGELLVEIQTKSFASLKRKLLTLTADRKVRLIHPIAQEKWIVKLPVEEGGKGSRRKSPKRGVLEQVFEELVSFPQLIAHPNFSLMVVLVQEEEMRRFDGQRGWRRKGWVTEERRLLEVVEQRLFESPRDLAALLPSTLPEPFTTSDLAAALGRPRRLAQQMAFCLREMGVILHVGKRGNAILYERVLDAGLGVNDGRSFGTAS